MANRNEPPPWDDVAVTTAANIWSYRRELALILTATTVVLLIGGEPHGTLIGIALILLAVYQRDRLHRWLHFSRVRRQWATAVITAGAADPPPKRSRKSQALLGPKVIRGETTAVGDLLTVKVGKGRGTVASLTAHREQLAADLDTRRNNVQEVRVAPFIGDDGKIRASWARVTIVRQDPLKDHAPIPWPNVNADRLSMWEPIPLGLDESGREVTISLVESNLLIGGIPGAGKSGVLSLVAATAALDPDCRLYLLDGKGEVEMDFWRPSAEILVGDDIEKANALLAHLRNAMMRGYQEMKGHARKVSPGDVLHVLICDELASYMQDPSATKKQRDDFEAQLLDLVQRGRAAGIILVLATQKPSAKIVPTEIRDLVGCRLALRCTTPQASDTILGQGAASTGGNAADPKVIAPKQPGLGLLLADNPVPIRTKAFRLEDDDITDIASRATLIWDAREDELQKILSQYADPHEGTTDLEDDDPPWPEEEDIPDEPEPIEPPAPRSGPETPRTAPRPPDPPPNPPEPVRTPIQRQKLTKREDVLACVPHEGDGTISRGDWIQATGRGQWKYLEPLAGPLVDEGLVIQTGKGVRSDPFRYYRPAANGQQEEAA